MMSFLYRKLALGLLLIVSPAILNAQVINFYEHPRIENWDELILTFREAENDIWINQDASDLFHQAITSFNEDVAIELLDLDVVNNLKPPNDLNFFFQMSIQIEMFHLAELLYFEAVKGGLSNQLDLRRAYNYAVFTGDLAFVKFLFGNTRDSGVSLIQPLRAALLAGFSDISRYLISIGAEIDGKGRQGGTVLQASMGTNDIELIEFLLKEGLEVNEANDTGGTAFLFAVIFADMNLDYDLQIIDMLVSYGADICDEMKETSTKYLTFRDIIENTNNLKLKLYYQNYDCAQ